LIANEKITIVFLFDEPKLTLSTFSRILLEFNRFSNLALHINDDSKDLLMKKDEFSDVEKSAFVDQWKLIDNSLVRKGSKIEILKISMNSPLEMILYSDIAIHIAILLLGGKRTGLFKYEVPSGLISQLGKLYKMKGK
jgi:hypothetical protein